MKHAIVIFLGLLLTAYQIRAQDSGRLASFSEKVLPAYYTYFSHAELSENGQLRLSAFDKYVALSAQKKKEVMTNIASSWRESLVFVLYGSKTEMWGWDNETGNTQLLDSWDINQAHETNTNKTKLGAHPLFIYLGYQMDGVSGTQDFNISLNVRVGCFLLANRWDVAALFSFTHDIDSTYSFSYGLSSRVHFPIRHTKLSPSIGFQVMGSSQTVGIESTSTTTTLNTAAVVGISWFVGVGSIDIDISIGNQVQALGGYTLMPGMLKR